MSDSIQSTLFNNHDKDAWKTVSYLEKELENIETLMSYDKRPMALANYDKRKKQLIALIQTKKVVEGNSDPSLKKPEMNKFCKKENNNKLEEILIKNKKSLTKLHEENGSLDIKFFGLINLNNIARND
jgi:hypothetical protein